jgi:hypothetical protein
MSTRVNLSLLSPPQTCSFHGPTPFVAVLRTGEKRKDNHFLPVSYLKIYENNSSMENSLFFRPGPKKCHRKKRVGKKHVANKRAAKKAVQSDLSDSEVNSDFTLNPCQQKLLGISDFTPQPHSSH